MPSLSAYCLTVLLSYLGFSYLGRGVSLHSCSSKAQPLLLTLDEGYLLTTTPPDLERGVPPLGPLAPTQQTLPRREVAFSYLLSIPKFIKPMLPHVQGAVPAQGQEGLEELSHVQGQEGQR